MEFHFIVLLSTSPLLCSVYMSRGGRGRGKWEFFIAFTLNYPCPLLVYAFLYMERQAVWFLGLYVCYTERKSSQIRKYLILILIILIYIFYLHNSFIRRCYYLSKAGYKNGLPISSRNAPFSWNIIQYKLYALLHQILDSMKEWILRMKQKWRLLRKDRM